jgi:hypothetical protein
MYVCVCDQSIPFHSIPFHSIPFLGLLEEEKRSGSALSTIYGWMMDLSEFKKHATE